MRTKYKRVLLKLSGESMMGEQHYGIDPVRLGQYAEQIRAVAANGVQVAVKTGTAQIGNGNTSIDGWVIGFAPADDPKIAVAVVVHNVDLYGSFAAGPIMKAMMQEALAE